MAVKLSRKCGCGSKRKSGKRNKLNKTKRGGGKSMKGAGSHGSRRVSYGIKNNSPNFTVVKPSKLNEIKVKPINMQKFTTTKGLTVYYPPTKNTNINN
jgi:hypothetical protein